MRLKREGLKAEPAFAKVLSLPGDPYVALLELEPLSNAQLQEVIVAATLFRSPAPLQCVQQGRSKNLAGPT